MPDIVQTVLAAISLAIGRWDALTGRPAYRVVGIVVGLCIFGVLLAAPSPEGLSVAAHRTGAVAVLMALWWVGRVLPMAITALVPLVAFPALGVLDVRSSAAPYAHPLNVLMLGGFVIGHAMEEAGLHHRLVATLLRPAWIRASPRRVVLSLMVAAALLSGLVSNTATTLMLLPVALSLARVCTDDKRLGTAFVLALAYAASIGGVSTLVGTPPNAVLASQAPDAVSFARWSAVGVPFVLVAVPVAWWVVTRVALPMPARFERDPKAPCMPRWSLAEAGVLGLLCVALLLWMFRKPLDLSAFTVPGWSVLFSDRYGDAFVAIAIALCLFVVPALPAERRAHEGRFLLSVRRLDKGVPWSVLLLLGGGFSLAAGIQASQLTEWLAGATTWLSALQGAFGEGSVLGLALAILVLCLAMTFLTELTSNTATSQIVLPILATGALAAGVDPLLWMVPATISASCAFMMPVATAPNAIASQAGQVAPGDMAWAGLVLNLALAVVVCVLTLLWVPLIFG